MVTPCFRFKIQSDNIWVSNQFWFHACKCCACRIKQDKKKYYMKKIISYSPTRSTWFYTHSRILNASWKQQFCLILLDGCTYFEHKYPVKSTLVISSTSRLLSTQIFLIIFPILTSIQIFVVVLTKTVTSKSLRPTSHFPFSPHSQHHFKISCICLVGTSNSQQALSSLNGCRYHITLDLSILYQRGGHLLEKIRSR